MPEHLISEQPYIVAGNHLGDAFSKWLSGQHYSGLFLLADTNTLRRCYPRLRETVPQLGQAHVMEVKPGERSKSPETCASLWQQLFDHRAERKSLLVNLGGGVIGDLGGFVASTYMRGIRFVQLPTTLLAMVDSAVGGKTGINFSGAKNLIGTFQQPEAVFADAAFLETLPQQDLVSGYAEVVKHALIEGGDHWELVLRTDPLRVADWPALIERSIRLKKDITDRDFREAGLREQLNLGHTVAHALESYYFENGKELLHGNAVAAGIIIEAGISAAGEEKPDPRSLEQLRGYIFRHFPPVRFDKTAIPAIMECMLYDKKNKGGATVFSLPGKPGRVLTGSTPAEKVIRKALEQYCEYA